MKRIYLIRHGQSEANLADVVPSREVGLSDLGKEQAVRVAERLSNLDIDTVIASEFPRAQETAKPTCEVLGLSLEISGCFNEMWEPTPFVGLPDSGEGIAEYRKKRRERIETDPEWKEYDGDSFADMFERFSLAEQFLINHDKANLAVFSHAYFLMGFVCKILLSIDKPSEQWLQMVLKIKKSNTGVTMFEYNEGKWRLITLNDHAHFAE